MNEIKKPPFKPNVQLADDSSQALQESEDLDSNEHDHEHHHHSEEVDFTEIIKKINADLEAQKKEINKETLVKIKEEIQKSEIVIKDRLIEEFKGMTTDFTKFPKMAEELKDLYESTKKSYDKDL